MKSSLIPLFLLLLTAFTGLAQSVPEPPDTIKTINNPDKVTVVRNGDTTLIQVDASTDNVSDSFTYEVTIAEPSEADAEPSIDFEIPFGIGSRKVSKTKHSRRRLQTSTIVLGNIYMGQRFNYSDKGNVKNSWELGVRNLIGMRWSHGSHTPSFSIGVGLGTQRYRAKDGFMYVKDGSKVFLIPVEEGYRLRSTEMNVFNFQIPLLFTLPLGCDVEFQIGAIGCLNTYAKAQTELEIDRIKYKMSYKGLQQRLFTAELTASLGVCDILGVYASWSPLTLFESPYGPQLKSWSIGATLNF